MCQDSRLSFPALAMMLSTKRDVVHVIDFSKYHLALKEFINGSFGLKLSSARGKIKFHPASDMKHKFDYSSRPQQEYGIYFSLSYSFVVHLC